MSDKYVETQAKDHKKRYEEIGKLDSAEQLTVNIAEKRKSLIKNLAKLQNQKAEKLARLDKDVTDKNSAEYINRKKNIEDEHDADITEAQGDLDKHTKENPGDVAKAAKDIRDKKKQDQQAFVDSRRTRAGKEFVTQNRAAKEKVKSQNAEIVEAVKNSNKSDSGDKKGK